MEWCIFEFQTHYKPRASRKQDEYVTAMGNINPMSSVGNIKNCRLDSPAKWKGSLLVTEWQVVVVRGGSGCVEGAPLQPPHWQAGGGKEEGGGGAWGGFSIPTLCCLHPSQGDTEYSIKPKKRWLFYPRFVMTLYCSLGRSPKAESSRPSKRSQQSRGSPPCPGTQARSQDAQRLVDPISWVLSTIKLKWISLIQWSFPLNIYCNMHYASVLSSCTTSETGGQLLVITKN